jgi:hypothetical protein
MAVTVVPAEFHLVLFQAADIERVANELLARLDWDGRDVRIEVDESSPIARCLAAGDDPVVVHAESGAFEEPRRPRTLSEANTATSLARVLLRVRDRAERFADAPDDADLTLAQGAAWDTYAIGRFGRLGYPVHEPRWRYNFRNRHGFTDVADQAFARLWAATSLTWDELSALSDGAVAARVAS